VKDLATRLRLRAAVALLLAFAAIAMHQMSCLGDSHAEMSMHTTIHVSSLAAQEMPQMTTDSAKLAASKTQVPMHNTAFASVVHACQALANPDFVMPATTPGIILASSTQCAQCSRFAAARQFHAPPTQSTLSIWRI